MSKKSKGSDSNKNKDNLSNFNLNQRSSKFDDLLSNNTRNNIPQDPKSLAKQRFKKIWKWTSIVIYLFLLGLGITGFIQSCVLKTTSTVGAGVEIYNNNNVAPYVTTYKVVEKEKEVPIYDEKGNPIYENGKQKTEKIKYYELEQRSKDNYLASNQTIKTIREQLETIYGEEVSKLYGVYDNYSSAIRILSKEGNTIDNSSEDNIVTGVVGQDSLLQGNKNNNFIFLNSKILDYLNQNSLKYQIQNDLEEINFYAISKPSNWNALSNSQKDYYGMGITDIETAFIPYEKINGTYQEIVEINGNYYTKDANGDGTIDSADYVQITDTNRISQFRFALKDVDVVSISKEETTNSGNNLLNSELFARDYLQSLANVIIRFSQLEDFSKIIEDKKSNTSPSTFSFQDNAKDNSSKIFEQFNSSNLEKLVVKNNDQINENNTFSLQQKNAILTYQNLITSLMEKIGFGIRKQVFSDENSNYYDKDANNTTPFEVEFLPDKNNKKDIIVGTSSTIQKPITSWADSWRLGPFYGLLVYPFSYITNGIINPMDNSNGWAGVLTMIVVILLTRIIVTLFTYKSLFATHKQQQLNPKKAKIDAKYEPFKGNREMEQRKRQEVAKLYKANNVSMWAPIKAMCISVPIFLVVWRVVQGIPDIKATVCLGVQFSLTSWRELFAGSWQYLPLLLIAPLTQAASHLLPKYLNKKRMSERANRAEIAALKKSNKTQNIVMIVFIVISLIFEAGVQIYWIISGLWQIMQLLVVHHIVKSNWYKTKGYKYL